MFYYEADIRFIEGEKRYGDLPKNFTVAYENESLAKAFFPFESEILNREVAPITKKKYEEALQEINRLLIEKRQTDFAETKGKIEAKQLAQEEMKIRLKATEDMVLQLLMEGMM